MKPHKPNKLARRGNGAGDKPVPRSVPGAASKMHAVLKSFDELRERLRNEPVHPHDEDES